ncbi:MAG: LysR family transcriptional regulator [Planctomycetota bacterium]
MLKARCRVWVEKAGRPVFGDGRAELLGRIDETGSIRAAAEQMGMSYRHAWSHLAKIEQGLGRKVVRRRVGGPGGGGSTLTPAGRRLLENYRRFRTELDEQLERLQRLL